MQIFTYQIGDFSSAIMSRYAKKRRVTHRSTWRFTNQLVGHADLSEKSPLYTTPP